MSRERFCAVLRPAGDGTIRADAVMSRQELADKARFVSLRHRLNPDMRAVLLPAPAGAVGDWREAAFAALAALSDSERLKLYQRGKNLG